METKQCLTCSKEKSLSDFPAQKKRSGLLYYRPHCYSCKYDKEIIAGRIPDKNYHREYYYSNMLDIKYKAYRHRDNSKYKSDLVLSRDDAVMIMMKPCHYCQKEKSNGIDRKDSNLGYTKKKMLFLVVKNVTTYLVIFLILQKRS